MSWAACRALSGLSATFSMKTSGVGRIGIHPMVFHDVVEECVCVFGPGRVLQLPSSSYRIAGKFGRY